VEYAEKVQSAEGLTNVITTHAPPTAKERTLGVHHEGLFVVAHNLWVGQACRANHQNRNMLADTNNCTFARAGQGCRALPTNSGYVSETNKCILNSHLIFLTHVLKL